MPATTSSTAVVPAASNSAHVSVNPDPALVKRIKDELQLTDSTLIATFGGEAQREVTSFADSILRDTANRDSDPIGELITSMIVSVNKLDPDSLRNASFFERLFGGIKGKVIRFREQFSSLASQVDRISLELERKQDVLKRDVAMMDGLFAKTLDQLKFLEAYVVAGGGRRAAREGEARRLRRARAEGGGRRRRNRRSDRGPGAQRFSSGARSVGAPAARSQAQPRHGDADAAADPADPERQCGAGREAA